MVEDDGRPDVGDGDGENVGADDENADSVSSRSRLDQQTFEKFTERLGKEPVKIRVHDITITGNARTKDWVIEGVLERLKNASTLQEVISEAARANASIERMGIFDKCVIRLEAGPKELPGTTNIVVEVEEAKRPFACDFGVFTRPEGKHWTAEGGLKWRNLLGYGEVWDGTGCYGWDLASEASVGVNFPRFRSWPASIFSRASLVTQDWHKYSSYRENVLGFSLGLLTDKNHELSYNLNWRHVSDPSHGASRTVRSQLGHDLLSSIKYSYKLDRRNSPFRPTRGASFATSIQIAGLGPDFKLSRFIKHDVDLRAAFPLGILNSAINVGFSGGVLCPWGPSFMKGSTRISDRFFMGGHSSFFGEMRGPCSLLGFRTRGIGPSESRRFVKNAEDDKVGRDALGGDLALNCFVDLSFDLPGKFLREFNIHGHTFACAGNVVGLGNWKEITPQNLVSTARTSAGVGIVIPTKICRLEINYCRVLRYEEHDRVKNGFQLSIAA